MLLMITPTLESGNPHPSCPLNFARETSSTGSHDPSILIGDVHAYIPPTESDSRGPCPALNTLANHGYIPRSGRHIKPEMLEAALQCPETYNLSWPLTKVLVHGGLFLMHTLETPEISLHELARHGCIEHDASMVHKDTRKGRKYAPTRCDTKLLDELLVGDSLTLDKVARRRVLLERVSPLDSIHQEIARGEWALVLDIFGREHGEVSNDFLRMWLKNNQFPDGWKPTHQQKLFPTMQKAREIRHKMYEYQQQSEAPEERAEVMGLTCELKSTSPTSLIMEEGP